MLYQEKTEKINNLATKLQKTHGNNLKASCFKPFMREKVQLVIEPYAELTDGKNPLSALHESFCRFAFTIIKEGKPASMNMRWITDTQDQAASFLEFRELYEYAKNLHIQSRFKSNSSSNNSPAYTLVFKSGNFTKGKTAVQVLKENSNGAKILSDQRAFLEKNVGTYKGNQQFIDAIDEALKLTSEQIASADSSIQILLFDSGLRSKLSTVLKGQKIQPNKDYTNIPCYNGSITFYPGMDYPFEVKISNFTATVKTDDKRLAVIDTKTAVDKVDTSISLTFNESMRLVEELSRYYDVKANDFYQIGIEASEKLVISERANNKNNTSQSNNSNTGSVSSSNNESNATSTAKTEDTAKTTEANNSKDDNQKKEIKVLKFQSNSTITKEDEKFILKAHFVRSNGSIDDDNEYTIIFNGDSTITKDEFISFRDLVNTEKVEFEIECFNSNDGIHVIKFAA